MSTITNVTASSSSNQLTPIGGANPMTPPMANLNVQKPIQEKETPPATTKPSPKTAPSGPPSADNQFIMDSISSILSAFSKSTDPKAVKLAADAAKRLEPLLEKLAKNEYSAPLTKNLTLLCQAVNNGDSRTAQNIHRILTETHWEELGSALGIGLKMLVQLTKTH